MFCAKCGSSLGVEAPGNFICPLGLQYSIHLSQRLRESYPQGVDTTTSPRTLDGAKRWSCPSCGSLLDQPEQPCAGCGALMPKDILYHLIELHPHPDGRGGWF
jgi:hypothetical protein